jgi:hypothetical protein
MSPNNLLMKLLIVVHHRFDLWNAPGWFAPRLRSEFPEIEIVHSESYDGIEDDLASAEVFFTFLLRPLQRRNCAGFMLLPRLCINCCFLSS